MPKRKTNFKNFSSKRSRLDTEKELENENPEDEETVDETEDETEEVPVDRGRAAEEVSDEEVDINSKEEKSVKERSFVWSHFEKITDDKNVTWAKCKYCR